MLHSSAFASTNQRYSWEWPWILCSFGPLFSTDKGSHSRHFLVFSEDTIEENIVKCNVSKMELDYKFGGQNQGCIGS